jgi:hypothetical protein
MWRCAISRWCWASAFQAGESLNVGIIDPFSAALPYVLCSILG